MANSTSIYHRLLHWLALLLLCAAYLQGSLTKLWDFQGATAEMKGFGLEPAALFAVGVIVLELTASALILGGYLRWLGAVALAVFTLAANFVALRFWELPPGQRAMPANAFFEHLGLVGGFVLVALIDLRERRERGEKTHG